MAGNSIGLGNELQIVDEQGDKRWALRFEEDANINLVRFNSSGVQQETVMTISATDGSITNIVASDADAVREFANDVVPTIVASDRALILADSTTGDKAILTDTTGADAVTAGQMVSIRLIACTGNSYTLALVSGTLTFNAAGEQATIVRNAANTGWLVSFLGTATIV